MNIGQVLETHLGWAAIAWVSGPSRLCSTVPTEREISAELARAWLLDRAWQVAVKWAWDWLAR
jgi:DNA-directed RNA polymerase subunit beta